MASVHPFFTQMTKTKTKTTKPELTGETCEFCRRDWNLCLCDNLVLGLKRGLILAQREAEEEEFPKLGRCGRCCANNGKGGTVLWNDLCDECDDAEWGSESEEEEVPVFPAGANVPDVPADGFGAADVDGDWWTYYTATDRWYREDHECDEDDCPGCRRGIHCLCWDDRCPHCRERMR